MITEEGEENIIKKIICAILLKKSNPVHQIAFTYRRQMNGAREQVCAGRRSESMIKYLIDTGQNEKMQFLETVLVSYIYRVLLT